MGSRALLSLIAASLSILATASEASVDVARQAYLIRGPWWWHGKDGAPWVAVATHGEPGHPVALPLDERPVAVTTRITALTDNRDGADHVLAMRLPPGSAGTLRFAVGGEPVHADLVLPPARNAAVRIALAGADAWPDRSGLDALARQLGGPPQLVLALGPRCQTRLGTGGWESGLPVAVVASPDPDLAAATAGSDADWRDGFGFGVLGLPAAIDRDRADLALANDLSPWLVYLDAPAAWDPAIGNPPSTAADLGVLVAACHRLKVPLILSAGASGLVSEPLVLEPGGALGTAADGVRVVLPVPGAQTGLARLDDAVALPLEQPILAGLQADLEHLALVLVRPDATDALRLAWGRDPAATVEAGAEAARRLAAAEDPTTDAADIATLLWMPRKQLTEAALPAELVARLRDEAGSAGRALARRLVVATADDPAIPAPPGEADPLALRDVLLWHIAHVRGTEALSWREAAATSEDPLVLRALLADLVADPDHDALPALRRRVELQATGALPVDPDPLDQQRLFSAVFDDIHASPTPLRPMAVQLLDKVQGLGRGPIERFLARNGLARPAGE